MVLILVAGDRLRPKSWRHTSDEASGTLVLDLIKTFFTAVIAFAVVVCWQQFQNAHDHTVAESKALVGIYSDARAMPAPYGERIEGLVRNYTDQVVGHEWPLMNHRGRLSSIAQQTLDSLHDALTSVPATDPAVLDLRTRALNSFEEADQARQDRALDQRSTLPGFLYIVLIFGTVLIALSPVLSGVRVSWRSVVMTGLFGIVIGSALLFIYELNRPYAGSFVVRHDAFDYALSVYRQND